jgi:hypothetical protein
MMVLSPAYGRDYANKAAVRADWEANKDFIVMSQSVWTGNPVNREQIEAATAWANKAMPGQPKRVSIRYARLRRTLVIDIIPK